MTKKTKMVKPATAPTYEEISGRAHSLWLLRDAVEGSSEDDWYRAEQELKAERSGVS